jgi:hypothetical protein
MTVPWRRAATIVVLLCAFSGVACADASTAAVPQPTPRLFLTQNYGIVARLPTGLTYCPLPADWVGSDHGSIMYLVPPSACPEIGEMAKAPSIVIYYVFNAADRPNADRPPFTATELAEDLCRSPNLPIPSGLVLLRRAGIGCRHDDAGWVEIELLALFNPERPRADEAPGSILIVSLRTTRSRLAQDLPVFAALAATVRACTPWWSRPVPGERACPPGNSWW